MTRGPALVRLAERWFRLLVRAYPASFREEMGEAMVEAYRDRARDAHRDSGLIGIVTLCARATIDTIRNRPGEYVRPAALWPRGGHWRRDALRVARTHPGLSAAVVLSAALGIGATTAVFSLVNAVLVRPLPYPSPNRLLTLMTTWRGREPLPGLSAAEFFVWRRTAAAVESSAAYRIGGAMTLQHDRWMAQVAAGRVSADFFALFGARTARGRTFTRDEDRPNGPAVVVVSHEFWRRQMNAASDALGRRLSLDGQPYDVIGVLESDFDPGPLTLSSSPRPAVWIPLQLDPATTSDAPLLAAARLRYGASIETAREESAAAAIAIRRTSPELMPEEAGLHVAPLHAVAVREVRPALLLLLGAVGLVLLIVCANTAHLLLVRAMSRQREIAIRLAAGASRWQVVRLLLTESLALSMIGGVLGVALAAVGVRTVLARYLDAIPAILANDVSLVDGRVLTFAVAVASVTGILFGLAPARQVMRVELGAVLRGGGEPSLTPNRRRLSSVLAVSEMALALTLLLGSALLVRSFLTLRAVDPGFDVRSIITMDMPLAGYRTDSAPAAWRSVGESLTRVTALPGIDVAAVTVTGAPLSGVTSFLNVTVPGRTLGGPYLRGGFLGGWQVVSPAYFDVLRIPLVTGRILTDRDVSTTTPVVVINELMARQLWPDESPLGQYLRLGEGAGPEFEEATPRQVVGVVGDVRHVGLEWDPRPAAYLPLAQMPLNQFSVLAHNGGRVTWVIRSRAGFDTIAESVQRNLQETSGAVAVSNVRSMREVSRTSTARSELTTTLMAAFGLTAVALAAIGVFGIMSHTVRERTREIAIRVALGASERTVLSLVLARGLRLSLAGISIGAASALVLSNVLQGVLFGVDARDWTVFVAMPLVLVFVAMTAVWIPARRAAKLDPIAALKHQ